MDKDEKILLLKQKVSTLRWDLQNIHDEKLKALKASKLKDFEIELDRLKRDGGEKT